MYQVRWGADYLMKMIGSGADADYLEIIYQVYCCFSWILARKMGGDFGESVGRFRVLCVKGSSCLCSCHAAIQAA